MRKIALIMAMAVVAVAAVLAPSVSARSTAGEADIVTTAVNNGSFKTLASLLTAAGLVDTLKGPGPFTVLAPTDEAFAKVPEGDARRTGRRPGEAEGRSALPRDRRQRAVERGREAHLGEDGERRERCYQGHGWVCAS